MPREALTHDPAVTAAFRRIVDQATPDKPLTVTRETYEALTRNNPANAARYRVRVPDPQEREP